MEWKFKQLIEGLMLEDEEVNQTLDRIYKNSNNVSRATFYRWYQCQPQTLDLEVVKEILNAIAATSNQDYSLSDLVEFSTQ